MLSRCGAGAYRLCWPRAVAYAPSGTSVAAQETLGCVGNCADPTNLLPPHWSSPGKVRWEGGRGEGETGRGKEDGLAWGRQWNGVSRQAGS